MVLNERIPHIANIVSLLLGFPLRTCSVHLPITLGKRDKIDSLRCLGERMLLVQHRGHVSSEKLLLAWYRDNDPRLLQELLLLPQVTHQIGHRIELLEQQVKCYLIKDVDKAATL